MSLRALASLLTRRLSARGAQAPRSAAAGTRPAPRALRTLVSLRFPQDLRSKISSLARSGSRSRPLSAQRDLGVGRGTVKGALALTSSLAGLLLGFLYFKQDRDDSAWEETRKEKEETVKWRDVIDPSVMANFTRKDGTFAYPDYFDYLRKCSDKEEAIVDDVANTDEEDNNVVDEAAMKSKFEDWMKEHDRRYITEKEKAHRYENFKKAVKGIDKLNIKRGMRSPLAAPTELADYTDEELQRLGILADESYWEEYLDHIHTAIARGYVFRVDDENVCEAVKKYGYYKEDQDLVLEASNYILIYAMFLRALASLLARRLSARGAQAQRSAAAGTRPAAPRSLRTIRDLGVGHGAVKGALALASSLAGLLGFLYFKPDRDDSAEEETRKEEEVSVHWRDVMEPSVMARFTRKDGTFAYLDYIDYLNSQMNHGGKPLYDMKCSEKEEIIVDVAADTDEDGNNVVDEVAMKAKFEDWMKEHGRRYITEKEKAHRYENFKKVVNGINKFNAKRGMRGSLLAPLAPNELADYSEEELHGLGTLADESHWEGYLDHVHTMIARGNDIHHNENACEAVKKAMFLRALASLLARRLSARGAQAQRSAAAGTRPAAPRSLRTIRDLGVGHGAVKGALALASSLAGLLGFLYFKPDRDDSAEEETRKEEEVSVHWRDVMEPSVMARFTRKDGTFAYLDYIDYLNSQMNHGGKPLYDMKCSEKEEIIVDVAADTDEDGNNVVDEVAMKAKFEDWMKEHGRRYITEKEKAHRYENFKKVVNGINKFNAKRGMRGSLLAPLAPNELADYSEEELHGLGTLADESHWEGYLDHVHTMIARGNDIHHNENACEAVKKRRRELFSMRDKAMRQSELQTNSS
uniref:Cathepsin propeptide inhibitor domain-containing protein n=1 Tax=Oryza punctata TaxID=4537 RepID=A0A0E0LN78_ORYPU